ncbi:MAG: hypothetical protein P4L46_16220 [Fimbriimonas sp.]|nr:hypothetical protein [Fimbriimonas sp.]
MKPTLFLVIIIAGGAFAETWTNHNGLTFSAHGWQIVQNTSKLTKIKARGGVTLGSVPDGMTITSDQLDFEAKPNPQKPKAYTLSHAYATKNVHIVKTVSSPTGKQITDVRGPLAEYSTGDIENTIRIIGPTTIQNTDLIQHQAFTATGSSGIAYLSPSVEVSSGNGLKRANLAGPVKVILIQAATKTEGASQIVATASEMQIENVGNQRRITLTGNVHVLGPGKDEATGMSRAVIVHDPGGSWRLDAVGGKS